MIPYHDTMIPYRMTKWVGEVEFEDKGRTSKSVMNINWNKWGYASHFYKSLEIRTWSIKLDFKGHSGSLSAKPKTRCSHFGFYFGYL
ncbi:hypothetical protein H5410_035735 [Solanum commersonii]|uniref:Uncharacterized protein n=1 Tax=Solanum commersonii TaxID=4109 RepID=A0A9J5Y3P6_SOLCO|nr:hypothetical protein H5410_035735 [Solanum commersonii]